MTTTNLREPMGGQMRRLAARRRPVAAAAWAAAWAAAHTTTGTVHACKHVRPREHRTG
jgi:hypothetical protein